jgi:hypothetical protein
VAIDLPHGGEPMAGSVDIGCPPHNGGAAPIGVLPRDVRWSIRSASMTAGDPEETVDEKPAYHQIGWWRD